MNDLEWLARNVHEWLYDDCNIQVRHNVGVYIEKDKATVNQSFTKDQWLARRAELQGKPSWDDAPDCAEWLSQDGGGYWYWYDTEPELVDRFNVFRTDHGSKTQCGSKGTVLGDWRNTLERRPEPEPESKQWTGPEDGLPPVGIVCEGYCRDSIGQLDWHKVEILKVLSNECAVMIAEKSKLTWCDEFRPLRSAEEKAVDEMVAIRKAHQWTDEEFCRELYRAGFRKVGSVTDIEE